MDLYPDEEDIVDAITEDERECCQMMVFEGDNRAMENQKASLHTKNWDVYMNDEKVLIKGSYYVEVSDSDGKNFMWEVVDDHVVEQGKEHDKIGL